MSYKINTLLADDNIDFGDLLNKYLSRNDDINVVGVARDGLQTVEMIEELKPDLVVLDIIMPGLDGLGVLDRVQKIGLDKKPVFIVLSAIGQDDLVQNAIQLGVDYYIVKPFDIEMLVSRIRQIYEQERLLLNTDENTIKIKSYMSSERIYTESELKEHITNLMCYIGIPLHMLGFKYIREAVLQSLIPNMRELKTITKHIYPLIAEKYKTSPQRVERSIRNAIESTWKTGSIIVLKEYSTFSKNHKRVRPTNSEFIAHITEKVKILLKQK